MGYKQCLVGSNYKILLNLVETLELFFWSSGLPPGDLLVCGLPIPRQMTGGAQYFEEQLELQDLSGL